MKLHLQPSLLALAVFCLLLMLPGSNVQANGYGYGYVIYQADETNFKLNSISPNAGTNQVELQFTTRCESEIIARNIRFSPPVRIVNHSLEQSNPMDQYREDDDFLRNAQSLIPKVTLTGSFVSDQNYSVSFPENFSCNGKHYVHEEHVFKMPQNPVTVELLGSNKIIELKSKQLLNVKLMNVRAFELQSLDISPFLLPALNMRLQEKVSFEDLQSFLVDEQKKADKLIRKTRDFKRFHRPLTKASYTFFPGPQKRNTWEEYSVPLSVLPDSSVGRIKIFRFSTDTETGTSSTDVNVLNLTDIALSYKVAKNQLMVWTTSLNTGKPLPNVDIMVLDFDGTPVVSGRTDSQGILTIEKFNAQYPYIVASTDTDLSFARFDLDGNISIDWIPMTQGVTTTYNDFKGQLFTERGIYRPGDSIHYKGTVRQLVDEDVHAPREGMEVAVTIRNSKNEVVRKGKEQLSSFGTFANTLGIEAHYPLGTYTITMEFGAKMPASVTFEVQEFRPPRHYVTVSCNRISAAPSVPVAKPEPVHKTGNSKAITVITSSSAGNTPDVAAKQEPALLSCEMSGVYFAGGPVKNGKLRWKLYLAKTSFSPEGFADYKFGNPVEHREHLIESGEAVLNNNGSFIVNVPLSEEVANGAKGIEAIATVVDFDGRASTETAMFQQKPKYLVGISRHKQSIVVEQHMDLRAVVLDPKGKQVKSGELLVEINREFTAYVLKKHSGYWNNAFWSKDQLKQFETSLKVPIKDGVATVDFDFNQAGAYMLKFTYLPRSGEIATTSTSFNVSSSEHYGFDYNSLRNWNYERLMVMPERTTYSPGETMRLFIKPHRTLSSLLVTVERDRIYQHMVIPVEPDMKYIDIPVGDAYAPNIYISVLGTVERGKLPTYAQEFDSEAPMFLFNVTDVQVRKSIGMLDVDIANEQDLLKAEPGDEVTLNLNVSDDTGKGVVSEITVGVVDESVLALTGYETPDLSSLARFTFPLSVFTTEFRRDLQRQTPATFVGTQELTGGGGLEKRPEASTSKIRKDFNPVAYFNSSVITDAEGNASVTFTLPDSMTTYRVYAVACDRKSGFGRHNRDLLAVRDFYLEPGMPRFLTAGDRFRTFISAFNKTDETNDVTVGLSVEGPMVVNVPEPTQSLPARDRVLIPLEGSVSAPGEATMRFSGTCGNLDDTIEITLPINSGKLRFTDILSGTFTNQKTITYDLPEGSQNIPWDELSDKDLGLMLKITGSPFIRMAPAMRWLLKYPYG